MKRKPPVTPPATKSTAVRIGGEANRIVEEHAARNGMTYKETAEAIVKQWEESQRAASLGEQVLKLTEAGVSADEAAIKVVSNAVQVQIDALKPKSRAKQAKARKEVA